MYPSKNNKKNYYYQLVLFHSILIYPLSRRWFCELIILTMILLSTISWNLRLFYATPSCVYFVTYSVVFLYSFICPEKRPGTSVKQSLDVALEKKKSALYRSDSVAEQYWL